jgi:hypothetical protein
MTLASKHLLHAILTISFDLQLDALSKINEYEIVSV